MATQTLTPALQIEKLTKAMNALEITISREQKHIAKFGEANDKDTDTAWETYKAQAEQNLKTWDELKAKRDALKASLN